MRTNLPLTALFALAFVAGANEAGAATKVDVQLVGNALPHGGLGKMRIFDRPGRVKAGEVAFNIVNTSTDLVHEMLVVRVHPRMRMPYDVKSQRVIEDKVQILADSDNIGPGGSKTVSATLEPGTYLLICNEPGHYAHGMRATLDVIR